MSLASRAFHLVTDRDYVVRTFKDRIDLDYSDESVSRFLTRFGEPLDFAGKSVLDVGCSSGILCVEAARRGATEVVEIDTELAYADEFLRERAPDVADRVRFFTTDGSLDVVADASSTSSCRRTASTTTSSRSPSCTRSCR